MHITWNITKQRGNLRPLLTYSVTLEEHEKALALPPLRVRSSIPEPEEAWREYCYPGELERAEGAAATSCYELETPSHKRQNLAAEPAPALAGRQRLPGSGSLLPCPAPGL